MTFEVLVTGARGKTGREVVEQLRDQPNIVVRAGSSRPNDQLSDGVHPVVFDWHDVATWRNAVIGANAIYLMRPDVPNAPDLVADLVALAPKAHIVLLSEQGSKLLSSEHWVRQVEDAVMERAETWTLLRPSWFQQVFTDPRFFRDAIRKDHVLSLPTGGTGIAWVDARDIGAVAVAALVGPLDHHGKAHTITGPEAVSVADIAAQLSSGLGYAVDAVDPPVGDVLEGYDAWTTEILEGLYRRVQQGIFAELSPAVEDITGRKPRPIQQFIDENLDVWRK